MPGTVANPTGGWPTPNNKINLCYVALAGHSCPRHRPRGHGVLGRSAQLAILASTVTLCAWWWWVCSCGRAAAWISGGSSSLSGGLGRGGGVSASRRGVRWVDGVGGRRVGAFWG